MTTLYALALTITAEATYSILTLVAIASMLWYFGRKPERQIADKEQV